MWNELAWSNVMMRSVSFAAGLLLTGLIVVLLSMIFLPIGQLIGNLLDSKAAIRSYSINIAGSLFGIWMFYLFCSLSLAPAVWLTAGIACFLPVLLLQPRQIWIGLTLGVLVVLGSIGRSEPGERVRWSPYHKLLLSPSTIEGRSMTNGYWLSVNDAYYQQVVDLSDRFRSSHPDLFPPDELAFDAYDIPFAFLPEPHSVLIVGAGAGNDVAAALRHTRNTKITAVEIDPQIAEVGKTLHPERPYLNPRVKLVIDDARAYFEKSKEKYDVVIFGLLDSHTLSSGFTNVRLDNYVYTRESFQAVKHILASDGLIFLKFAVKRSWIGAKLYLLLSEVYGFDPLIFRSTNPPYRGAGGDFLVSGSADTIQAALSRNPDLAHYIESSTLTVSKGILHVEVPSDDWPYLYVENRSVPATYLWLMALLVCIAAFFFLRYRSALGNRLDLHFFLLGAGFLLIEFQSIHRLSLFFGNTWIITGIVISAIFVMILLANAVTNRIARVPTGVLYILLAATILITYVFPYQRLLAYSVLLSGCLAGFIQVMPIFFSGLIFARSFQESMDLASALGSNLAGSFVGGMAEGGTFLIGIRAVVLIGLVFYFASWLYRKRPIEVVQVSAHVS